MSVLLCFEARPTMRVPVSRVFVAMSRLLGSRMRAHATEGAPCIIGYELI